MLDKFLQSNKPNGRPGEARQSGNSAVTSELAVLSRWVIKLSQNAWVDNYDCCLINISLTYTGYKLSLISWYYFAFFSVNQGNRLMRKNSLNRIVLIFLTFAFSIACTQAVMATTTTSTDGSGNKGPKLEAAKDNGSVLQAITPGPVPAELIVSGGGLEWVYASPCVEGGCSNPSPTNQAGWRYATYEELTQQFPGCEAFVRQDQSNICASAYFDPIYTHCDIGDCRAGYVCSAPDGLCANGSSAQSTWETFYVQGEAAPAIPVPVLSTLGIALLILGLVLFARRRATA